MVWSQFAGSNVLATFESLPLNMTKLRSFDESTSL